MGGEHFIDLWRSVLCLVLMGSWKEAQGHFFGHGLLSLGLQQQLVGFGSTRLDGQSMIEHMGSWTVHDKAGVVLLETSAICP
jgi:hypothetical protein